MTERESGAEVPALNPRFPSISAAAGALSLVLALGALPAPGQTPAPGLRLFGASNGTTTRLVDTNGSTVQTWTSAFTAGLAVELDEDGTLLRCIRTPGAPMIGGAGGGVQRLGLDSTVSWDFRYDGPAHWSHHDLEILPNGNVLIIAWENKTVAQAVAAGRNPALIAGTTVRVDHVIEVQPTGPTTGNIVWEWHVFDHLIQDFDPLRANFGVVAARPGLVDFNYPPNAGQANDWNHMNSVEYDPIHDWVILSAHNQNEIWVIDHGTTTAEAAGHTGGLRGRGGDLLYRWGNPQAYDAGTAANQLLYGQHSAKVIPPGLPGAGNFMVFNNNYPGGSQVWEFVPPLDASGNFVLAPGAAYGPAGPIWTYSAAGFNSTTTSSCERLPNGNTLVCSGAQGRIFEITSAGQVVWNYILGSNLFHAHYVERRLWSGQETVSGAAGGTVRFDFIAGTPEAGRVYLLLASASGTSPGISSGGFVLPLNPDAVFDFTVAFANTPILTQTLGALSSLGRATSFLNLPALSVPGPVPLHFAGAVLDPLTLAVTATTNAVPLTILP